jgi:PAS domain S-box/PAS domain S-box
MDSRRKFCSEPVILDERARDQLAAICEFSEDAILGMTSDGIITGWNHGACELYGYSDDEAIGRSVSFLIPLSHGGELDYILDTIRNGRRIEHFDTVRVRKDGSHVEVSLTASPIKDNAGRIIGVSWIARDITERKTIERALRESEEKYRAIFEQSAVGIARVRPDGVFIEVNRKYCDILGYSREELLGKNYVEITYPQDLEKSKSHVSRLLDGKIGFYTIEKRYMRKDGLAVWVSLSVSLVRGEDGEPKYLVPVTEDITERKKLEKRQENTLNSLSLLARRREAILKSMDEGLIETDVNGNIIYINRYALDRFGFRSSGEAKMNIESFADLFQMSYAGGKPVPWRESPLLRASFGEEFSDIDIVVRRVDMDQEFTGSFSGMPVISAGRVISTIVTFRDVTERMKKEAELASAKRQAELYLDLLGHDINNINMIAMGFLEVALESFELSDEEREFLEKPLDALRGSTKLIENVRKLQMLEEGGLKCRKIDLCDVLAKLVADYSSVPGRSVAIRFQPIPGCYVLANDLIQDVFSNLIGNAIKHSDPCKPLAIDIGLEPITMKGVEYYQIAIEDNGPGIPDAFKNRLFMRFQRGQTKASGKGLGLYLVRTLISDFHGKIWVEDRVPGDYTQGTKFVVMLPAM